MTPSGLTHFTFLARQTSQLTDRFLVSIPFSPSVLRRFVPVPVPVPEVEVEPAVDSSGLLLRRSSYPWYGAWESISDVNVEPFALCPLICVD